MTLKKDTLGRYSIALQHDRHLVGGTLGKFVVSTDMQNDNVGNREVLRVRSFKNLEEASTSYESSWKKMKAAEAAEKVDKSQEETNDGEN